MYLESQGIVNINWDKLHNTSQSVLSTISNVVATMTGQIDGGSNSADILLTIAASLYLDKTANSDE